MDITKEKKKIEVLMTDGTVNVLSLCETKLKGRGGEWCGRVNQSKIKLGNYFGVYHNFLVLGGSNAVLFSYWNRFFKETRVRFGCRERTNAERKGGTNSVAIRG